MSLATVSLVTRATENGIVLPHLFMELPQSPKTNSHQQAAVEPYLESLLPATVEPPDEDITPSDVPTDPPTIMQGPMT